MKAFRKQISGFMIFIIVLTVVAPVHAFAGSVGGHEISSSGACVMDFETGITLYEFEADKLLVPASMTKLISVFVIFDAISSGEINLSTSAKISQGVSTLSYNWEYSNVPLPEGISVTVKDLLDVVLVCSACAATVALAEALCGSEKAFVSRMNEKVEKLGITATFSDCFGVSANNKISPRGMAELTRNLIKDHPEILDISSKRNVTFRGLVYKNTNQLLGEYSGIDGLKTGYTDAAGYCFTGTAQRDGRRIIAVTMGSSVTERFPDARALLDYGFANAEGIIADFNEKHPELESENEPGNDPGNKPDVEPEVTAEDGLEAMADDKPEDETVKVPESTAYPSNANLILNGVEMPLNAYLIGGSHYFKLRDIAFLLIDTDCKFDVTWSSSLWAVIMTSGRNYPFIANVQGDIGEDVKPCSVSSFRFFLDDVEYSLEAYVIDGNNFLKLRDLGELIGFWVDWEGETRTVFIDTVNVDRNDNLAENAA